MTDDAETYDRTYALRSLAAALDQSDVRARAEEVWGGSLSTPVGSG